MIKLVLLVSFLACTVDAKQIINCSRANDDEFTCLACNIFHESGNQSLEGKIAVGAVTINRVKSIYYPNSICKVVWQKNQFSWTHDKKEDDVLVNSWWTQAQDIAKGFMVSTGRPHGAFVDPTKCALFYHADYVSPYWRRAKQMRLTTQIENHIFYKNLALGCPNTKTMAVSGNSKTLKNLN